MNDKIATDQPIVGGYGYQGPRHLSVAYETGDFPALRPRKMMAWRKLRVFGRFLLNALLTLRALPGLLIVMVMMRSERAINRYHHRHPGLDVGIIVLAIFAGFAVIAIAVLTI